MRIRPSLMSVAAAGTLAAGLCLGATPAASAAAGTRVDARLFVLYTNTDEGGNAADAECYKTVQWHVSLSRVESVANTCEFRLYLQQRKHGGWSYCINPHSDRNIPKKYRKPKYVKVATSMRKC